MSEYIAARNLHLAERARDWVRRAKRITAANRKEDNLLFQIHSGIVEIGRKIMVPSGGSFEEWARNSAALAERLGFGKCGEMSALAFQHLEPMVRPLSLVEVQFHSIWGASNHGFIVIGRSMGAANPDLRKWNPECAVCDAWADKAYLLRDIEKQMPRCDFSQGAVVLAEVR